MINIAVVEDEEKDRALICKYFDDYSKRSGRSFRIKTFENPAVFLASYSPEYDIVFMDIELPDMNGMECAARLRAMDDTVTLVFVTNMAQYAVKGYEVNAIDFIVKPVKYFDFEFKLDRILSHVNTRTAVKVNIKTDGGVRCIAASSVKYVEIIKHKLIYHTTDDDIETYGTLKDVEGTLIPLGFTRCNNCYLVNLRYVTGVDGYTVTVGDEELLISHPRRKEFMQALNRYLGDGAAQ